MARRTITVYMSDGDTITTEINGTDKEIVRHYLGHRFEAGCDTEHHVALLVRFHDTGKKYGLRIKNIESGSQGWIDNVYLETVKVDDNESFDQVILTTLCGAQYDIADVWVFDPNGKWITGIGFPRATAS
jgi:hypothetical protein